MIHNQIIKLLINEILYLQFPQIFISIHKRLNYELAKKLSRLNIYYAEHFYDEDKQYVMEQQTYLSAYNLQFSRLISSYQVYHPLDNILLFLLLFGLISLLKLIKRQN